MHFQAWSLRSKAREKAWDPSRWEWIAPDLAGELGSQTRLGDILPNGIDLGQDLGWTGQPGDTYFDLKDRIIETQRYSTNPNNVMLAAGANNANFIAMLTLLESGDEVIVSRPSWPQFQKVAEGIGATVKTIDLEEQSNWRWNLEKLETSVSRNTKLICVCNPNNPTGTRIDETEVKKMTDIAKSVGAWILCDESFRWYEWDRQLTPTWVNFYDRAIVTTSVSKMLSGDGLRIGWLVSQNEDFIKTCEPLRNYCIEHINVLGTMVAWSALDPERFKSIIEEKWKDGNSRLMLVANWMKKVGRDYFIWVQPDAGFLSFPKYKFQMSSDQLCQILSERYGIYLSPGTAYDMEYHLRFGFGRVATQLLEQGLKSLERFFEDYERDRFNTAKPTPRISG